MRVKMTEEENFLQEIEDEDDLDIDGFELD